MTNINHITGKYEQTFLNEAVEKPGTAPAAGTTEAVEPDRPQDDRVSLSNASRDRQAAQEAVAAVSDVRQDKVDALKALVESGNYEINPAKIADKMVGAFVDETS